MATFVFNSNNAEATQNGSSQQGEKKYTQKELDNAVQAEHDNCRQVYGELVEACNKREEGLKKKVVELEKELAEAKEKLNKKSGKCTFARDFSGSAIVFNELGMFVDGVKVTQDDLGIEVGLHPEVHIKGSVERIQTMSGSVKVEGDVTRVNTMSGSVKVTGKCDRVSTMSGSIHHG